MIIFANMKRRVEISYEEVALLADLSQVQYIFRIYYRLHISVESKNLEEIQLKILRIPNCLNALIYFSFRRLIFPICPVHHHFGTGIDTDPIVFWYWLAMWSLLLSYDEEFQAKARPRIS